MSIALDAKKLVEQGRSLTEVRQYIDSTYGHYGPGTRTPLPPTT